MKTYRLIALIALILCAALLIAVSQCTEPKPDEDKLVIKLLKERIAKDSLEILAYKAKNDTLKMNIKQQEKEIAKERKKRIGIESKYAEELARIQKLPDDSAVGLFLDKSDTGEHPILKYDSSYLIPIEPIRVYNDLMVGYNYLLEINSSLVKETVLQDKEIKDLKQVVTNDSIMLQKQEDIISDGKLITAVYVDENKQLKKQLKKQKTKTVLGWIGGTVGGAAIMGGLMMIIK